jgi:hypothetical protein
VPSIHNIVDDINKSLVELNLAEAVYYGVAQTAIRSEEKIPAIVTRNGELSYVGVDDKRGVIVYHKLNSLTTRVDLKNSIGRQPTYINQYSLSAYVYLNRRKVKLLNDEFYNSMVEAVPTIFSVPPYQSVTLVFNSVLLNDMQVWAAEYSEPYRLPADQNLFQVNYTVEASFLRGCFNKCE